MYVTEGIVLNAKEIRDTERVYTLFTKDFWKISAFYKETKLRSFDTGSVVEIHVDRKNGANRLKRMESVLPSPKEGRSYADIVRFLEAIHLLNSEVPENAIETELYKESRNFLQTAQNQQSSLASVSVLFALRACHVLGIGHQTIHSPKAAKVAALAETNTLKELLLIRGIDDDTLESLRTSILHTLQSSSSW